MKNDHPHLPDAPITEVVVGFRYDRMPLSTPEFGIYWNERREDFPEYELQPALREQVEFGLDSRLWLISPDDQVLAQIQDDRFYLNWKKGPTSYPRFRTHAGRPGLRDLALKEFGLFCKFVESRGVDRPTVRQVEVTKIDLLQRGKHYQSSEDLGRLLKVVSALAALRGELGDFRISLAESGRAGGLSERLVVGGRSEDVRIETHVVGRLDGGEVGPPRLRAALDACNIRANELFFGVVERGELSRFGAGS